VDKIASLSFENKFAIIHVDDKIPLWKVFTRLNDIIDDNLDALNQSEVILLTGSRTISGGDIYKLYYQLVNRYSLYLVRIFSSAQDIDIKGDIPVVIENMSKLKGFLTKSEIFEARATLFIKKNVRSGHNIEFKGHIVIYGNVNPGSVIRATGNVTILGKVLGSVWAGCGGNTESFIVAGVLSPTQIRIADCVIPGTKIRERDNLNQVVVQIGKTDIEIIDLDTFTRG